MKRISNVLNKIDKDLSKHLDIPKKSVVIRE